MHHRVYWYEKLIRKLEKKLYPDMPEAATWDEWKEYRELQKVNKIRYFIAKTLPSKIENIFWPYYKWLDLYWWVMYRFAPRYKYYLINTKLKPNYYDTDTRMLNGIFSLLVDFVECEKAWMKLLSKEKPSLKDRWNTRNRQAGLEYLDWEISLGDSSPLQSECAKKVKELYIWWTDVRPNRMDPYDLYNKELSNYQEVDKLELDYYNEDTEKMVQLIQIREGLWT